MLLSLESTAKSDSQSQLDKEEEVMDIKCGGGKNNNLKSIPHPLASCHPHTPFLCQGSSCCAEEDFCLLKCACNWCFVLMTGSTHKYYLLLHSFKKNHPRFCCQTRQSLSLLCHVRTGTKHSLAPDYLTWQDLVRGTEKHPPTNPDQPSADDTPEWGEGGGGRYSNNYELLW